MSSLSNNEVKKFIVKTSEREIKMCLTLKSQDHNQGSQLLIESRGGIEIPILYKLHLFTSTEKSKSGWKLRGHQLLTFGRKGGDF